MISRDEVERLAALARIKLTPDEAERARADLDAILAYVRELDAVEGNETALFRPLGGGAREDRFSPLVSGKDARPAFPKERDGYCETPRVFGEATPL